MHNLASLQQKRKQRGRYWRGGVTAQVTWVAALGLAQQCVPKASRGCCGACWHHCALVPTHLGRQKGRNRTHNTMPAWVAMASPPRNGLPCILLHLKQIKKGSKRGERHEALPRALPKPQPCSPRGVPAHAPTPAPGHSPRSSAVQ